MRLGRHNLDFGIFGRLISFCSPVVFAGLANEFVGTKVMVLREARQGELRDRLTSMRWTLRGAGGAAGGLPRGARATHCSSDVVWSIVLFIWFNI